MGFIVMKGMAGGLITNSRAAMAYIQPVSYTHLKWHLKDALDRYRAQGAPQNQQVLIALLQEVQAEKGGVLPQKALKMCIRDRCSAADNPHPRYGG